MKINFRVVGGLAAGITVWWLTFYISLGTFVLLWPEILDAGQAAVRDNDWSLLTTPMLVLFTVMYFWVNPIAGWLTVRITRNLTHTLITAIPLILYAAFQHWYALWGLLPDWYNIIVVLLIPPLVYLGGKMAAQQFHPNTSVIE